MRAALKILAVLVIGTALGLFATWATVVRGTMGGAVADELGLRTLPRPYRSPG